MKKHNIGKIAGLVALAGMLIVPSAKATIIYSVGAAGPLTLGTDTVMFDASGSQSVNPMANGPSVSSLLNNVTWHITTPSGDGTYAGTLTRNVTVSVAVAPNQVLSQTVSVTIKAEGKASQQTLTISSASPVLFSWTESGLDYLLQVTALSLDLKGNGSNKQLPTDVTGAIMGDFTLTSTEAITAVPEASTVIAGALLLLPFGASTFRILRKNRGTVS